MTMRAILVDPHAKEVKLLHGDFNDLKEIYKSVLSYDVSVIPVAPNLNLLVDQMGMYRRRQEWWLLGAMPLPLAGRGLLLGRDPETGWAKDTPYVSPRTVEGMVEWIKPARAQMMVPPANPPHGFETLDRPVIDMSPSTPRGSV